jgi:hypothetical protein
MRVFEVYNGPSLLHRGEFEKDLTTIQAESMDEAITKIEEQWNFTNVDLLFVTNGKRGRLVRAERKVRLVDAS